jgi:hypothetical protein
MSPRSIGWWRPALVAVLVVLGAGLGTAWAAYTARTSNGENSFSAGAAADSTPPTIARATVAKASGGSAGVVRQGGEYHVYAEVTDAGSGVNTVTANTSSFDSGVTSASLTATGGPWTVGGQSYNRRSAGTLTADTGLATGSSLSYTITATDNATNQAGPSSYSATIETYDSVITGTSGLISFWRFGDGALSADDFTDAAGTVLTSHTGELGATWTEHPGQGTTGVVSSEGRLRRSGSQGALYYTSATPSSANYLVEADVHVKSILANDVAGIVGRFDTASAAGAGTNYLARYDVPSGSWQLRKNTATGGTALGAYAQTLTAGQTYRLGLQVSGSTIKMFVDGVERASATDTEITAAGRGGVRLGPGTAVPTNTAGLHMDNFRITSLTTTASDAQGANNGTYINGPRLNQPGALAGDSDRAAVIDGSNDHVRVPDSTSLDLGDGPFALEAWVKRSNANAGWLDIVQKGANAYQFAFYNSFLTIAKDDCCTIVESTTTITNASWHHLVVTKDGASVKLYVDGVDRTSTVSNQTLVNTTSALTLGAKNGTSEFLAATIDEFAIYNQALSAATVLDHYRAGAGTG